MSSEREPRRGPETPTGDGIDQDIPRSSGLFGTGFPSYETDWLSYSRLRCLRPGRPRRPWSGDLKPDVVGGLHERSGDRAGHRRGRERGRAPHPPRSPRRRDPDRAASRGPRARRAAERTRRSLPRRQTGPLGRGARRPALVRAARSNRSPARRRQASCSPISIGSRARAWAQAGCWSSLSRS